MPNEGLSEGARIEQEESNRHLQEALDYERAEAIKAERRTRRWEDEMGKGEGESFDKSVRIRRAVWESYYGELPPRNAKGYPDNWAVIATAVKDAAEWQCVRCGHPHEVATGYVLTVHHLDMQPRNCAWWNLVALCQRCHLKVQGKVRMDRPWPFDHSEWFQPYVAGFYAKKYLGLDLTREAVMDRLDELLALEVDALRGAL